MISVAESQVIFRIEKDLLDQLDSRLQLFGFKTRNEWFRAKVREFVEEADKKRMLKKLDKLTVEGIKEQEIVQMVKDWRKGKGSN
jgi:metal-responsive CopG/Arc/MetJ family transcriptional regulator